MAESKEGGLQSIVSQLRDIAGISEKDAEKFVYDLAGEYQTADDELKCSWVRVRAFYRAKSSVESDKEGLLRCYNSYDKNKALDKLVKYVEISPHNVDARKDDVLSFESGAVLNMYSAIKDSFDGALVDFMLQSLAAGLNMVPMDKSKLIEYFDKMRELQTVYVNVMSAIADRRITALDKAVREAEIQLDEAMGNSRGASVVKEPIQNPLHDVPVDERKKKYESANQNPVFNDIYCAYSRAAVDVQTEEDDDARLLDFKLLFGKYLNGRFNVPEERDPIRFLKDNEWAYIFFVNGRPRIKAGNSPLSVEELFEVPKEEPKIEKPVNEEPKVETPEVREPKCEKPKGLFARIMGLWS